jgi:hypothetical protein
MSCILYYSNFCNHSKNIIQTLSKTNLSKDIHFICIDKRIKEDNKTYIILENGQRIILPETVNRVPALLLLNNNYNILYGEAILHYFKPKQDIAVKQATNNNSEPMAFSFGGGSSSAYGIMSDNYSFLDMNSDDLSAKGDGGVRQMHNYVHTNYVDSNTIPTPADESSIKANKIPEGLTIEQLQQQREQEFKNLTVTGNDNQRRM